MKEQILTKTAEPAQAIVLADGRRLDWSQPLVMGVLNVTPDSFSDGGHFMSPSKALEHVSLMIREGADIIDIGGESTRPGAERIDGEEERKRVIPVIEAIRKISQIPISIDTYKAKTAQAALEVGADIVNDISALRFDADMAKVVASHKAPVVLMHILGTPRDMQVNPHYDNCVKEIARFFEERIAFCETIGIDRAKLILDPGIGFGKRLSDNLEILAGLRRFKSFGLPVMVGVSRKSFIKMLHPREKTADKRIGGSIAAAVAAVNNGADILRVHDVEETVEALKVLKAIKEKV